MQPSTTSKFRLPAFMASVAVSACGGGGGDAPSQPALAVPSTADTGLAAPTRTFKREQHLAPSLVNEALVSYHRAAGAAALNAAGRLATGLGQAGRSPSPCSGGGNISFTNAAGQFSYGYNACLDGSYAFTGTSSAVAAGTGWQQTYTALQAGTPPGPLAGTVTCTPPSIAGAALRCLVVHNGYTWGYDARFEAGQSQRHTPHRRRFRLERDVLRLHTHLGCGAAFRPEWHRDRDARGPCKDFRRFDHDDR